MPIHIEGDVVTTHRAYFNLRYAVLLRNVDNTG